MYQKHNTPENVHWMDSIFAIKGWFFKQKVFGLEGSGAEDSKHTEMTQTSICLFAQLTLSHLSGTSFLYESWVI